MPRKKTEEQAQAPPSGSSGNASWTSDDQIFAYARSGKSGICITSFEETRVEAEIIGVVDRLNSVKKPGQKDWNLHIWSVTQGIDGIPETEDPLAMLAAFQEKCPERSIMLARDFHAFLAGDPNPMLVRKLKEILMDGKTKNKVFIVCGAELKLPIELQKEMAVIEFKLPDRAQLNFVLEKFAESAGVYLDGNREPILDSASGLTTSEAEDAFAMSVVKCGDIKPEIIAAEKAQTIKKNGILELFETTARAEDIGGLENLKGWLAKRRAAFTREAKDYGLPTPKGILVTGIPGVGKSLTAKAAASILNVPLLKLDVGRVFGSLVGQSEQNMRMVIETAEAIAPCLVWCDEIEKGLGGSQSSGQTDGGTTARVFGTFLQWMQDKTAPVFVFATANDISKLPPEFLRKGRFDELWFADLPDADERAQIWRLHLNKRGRKADGFDIESLATRSEGFTGAEIEAAVCEALFASFDDGKRGLNDDDLLESIRNTVPLSRTMAAQIDGLRSWAQGRARRASAVKETTSKSRKIA